MSVARTSKKLKVGDLYTRRELANKFAITDATLNTGVFQPKGSASVWLFVTRKKPANRTQYVDSLTGDLLNWQGQTSGRTDLLIIEHDEQGLELLLFYREKADTPFRYEGVFEYAEHSGARPATFKLRRSKEN
jgi:hypothetical protein